MRIVGGEQRGRALSSPTGVQTRPTSDRARQAIFNILEHASWRKRDLLDGADVLDVFAGTGAMGLEALSRGARHGVFIERDPAAARVCEDNIRALGQGARAILLKFDATKPPSRPAHLAVRSLVFLDPPYGKGLGAKALTALAAADWLTPGAVCVLEMARKEPEEIPEGFLLHDERNYGVARVAFLEWQEAP
jgi:16S rRNA (guanine966-N2)-methyltransferase